MKKLLHSNSTLYKIFVRVFELAMRRNVRFHKNRSCETSLRSRRSVNRQSVSDWERKRILGEKSTGLLKASNTADSNLKATGRPDGWFIRPVMSCPCLTFPFVLLHRLSKLLLSFSFFLLNRTDIDIPVHATDVHSTDSLGERQSNVDHLTRTRRTLTNFRSGSATLENFSKGKRKYDVLFFIRNL